MRAIKNMQNGLSVPQREVPLGGSWIDGIPIEHANWEELLGYGGGYSQEMQNRNATAGHLGRIAHLSTNAGFLNSSINYTNGSVDTGEADFQASVAVEGYWNSSWSHILELMKAPSAIPDDENLIPNKVSDSTNKHCIPSSSSSSRINKMPAVQNTQLTTSVNGMAIRNATAAKQLGILESVPQQFSSTMRTNAATTKLLNKDGYLLPHRQPVNNSFTHDEFSHTHHPQNSQIQTEATAASGITNSNGFEPATPEKTRRTESFYIPATAIVSVDQPLSVDTSKQKCVVLSDDDEGTVQRCHKPSMQHLVETPSTAIGTQLEERNDTGKGVNDEFDLNRTPSQKAPKRRKHRPKVVREGKPKRGRKPGNQEDGGANKEKRVKRKYVRKNAPKEMNTPPPDAAKEIKDAISRPASRSCRRSLNFEEDKNTVDESQRQHGCDPEGTNQKSQTNIVSKNSEDIGPSSQFPNATTSTFQQLGRNMLIMGNKEAGLAHRLHQTTQPVHSEVSIFSSEHTPTTQSIVRLQSEKDYVTDSNTIQRAIPGSQRANYNLEGAHRQTQAGASQSLHQQIAVASQPLHQQIKTGADRSINQQIQTRASQLLHQQIQTGACQSLNHPVNVRTSQSLHQQIPGASQPLHQPIQTGAGQSLNQQIQTRASQLLHQHIQTGAGQSLNQQIQTRASQLFHQHIQTGAGQPVNHQVQARTGQTLYPEVQAGTGHSLYHQVQGGTRQSPHPQVQAGTGNPLYKDITTRERLQRIMQGMAQQLQQRTPHLCQGRGSKRDYPLISEAENASSVLLGRPTLLNRVGQVHEQSMNRDTLERDPEDHKKMRVENRYDVTNPIAHRVVGSEDGRLRQHEAANAPHISVNQLVKRLPGTSNPHYMNSCVKPNNGLNHMIGQPYVHSAAAPRIIQRQHSLTAVGPTVEPMGGKKDSLKSPSTSPITAIVESAAQFVGQSNTNRVCNDRHRTKAPNKTNPSSLSTKRQEKLQTQKPVSETAGSRETRKSRISINEIIRQFQYLSLNSTEGALVPYKGTGTMVPYEAFDPTKRRKPRPKVDLDPETNRKWKLLMGKEASTDDQEMDADKAKWWEEERKVFRGRADSFIARMHLVQGDRRFSRWKGSVVDSVIGVFLTQNVTDHLSSSAFMSLAARFPVQSTSNAVIPRNDPPCIIIEEPEPIVFDSDNAVEWPKKSASTIYSGTPNEVPDKTSRLGETQNWGVEEVISSQDSAESSTIEVAGRTQSSSGWHSREHYATSGLETASNCCSTSFIHQVSENITRHFDSTGQLPQNMSVNWKSRNETRESRSTEKNLHEQHCRVNNINGSTSVSFPFDLNMPHTQEPVLYSSHFQISVSAQSELSEVQSNKMCGNDSTGFDSSNASAVGLGAYMGATSKSFRQAELRKDANGGSCLQESPNTSNWASFHQTSNEYHQRGGTAVSQPTSRSENKLVQRQIREAAEVPKVHNPGNPTCRNEKSMSVAGKEVPTANKAAESISKEQLSSCVEEHGEASTKMHKTKGAKIETDKKTTFDWDSLRKQLYSDGVKRERVTDAMDSMDYEAMRHADASEVSDAIKERGMNHMLAERIKAFLNRIVSDHGSIDLEWLKEVPPDKAKDYLLSIWGLGLKSVECVRLLTLHQHAFPVDTNVGRIAVRLGWVPLQPLPESLQLHLLELYPVLESIQKYLWPRLCTLDQRTLYELHYQLITFGKVFCTKSKPNCNACPLRGECRHFASAFTSARLALPGPEEKSMVTSAVPVQTVRQPMVNANPVPQLPLEHKPPGQAFEPRSSEPIVEEPTTPEPEAIDISETDIEDAFFEDPDEIPTIKLSAEDITTLKNYIKENVELDEGDMSKALVALSPEAAQIPTQKLKNVSRLRTEHQVYELPDTHPLLRELDKREPDDPSPYLLAIWTPGETANSVLPPEGTCKVQDSGKLCTEETCFSCNSKRESNSQIVRGTILIPCRTAMRGSFPLNGTYFQVNEMFADHDSSLKPIEVPRECIWNLPRRTVYFGSSVSTIFKGMSTEDIQYCFWRGFVCVRGFDRKTRAPRPLMARLHFPLSKLVKEKKDTK